MHRVPQTEENRTTRHLKRIISKSSPHKIKAHLDRFMVGQDRAKEKFATAIYLHYRKLYRHFTQNAPLRKNGMLLVGPTGSGKTFMVRLVADYLGIPHIIINAKNLADASYRGTSTEDEMQRLSNKAPEDLLPLSIVYIDEIDKLSVIYDDSNNAKLSIQMLLLKVIEGSEVKISSDSSSFLKHIDTTPILFIAGGAFEPLLRAKANTSPGVGFISENKVIKEIQITSQDIIDFGILPELVGRLSTTITLKKLTEDDLYHILTSTEHSVIAEYTELLSTPNISVEFTEDAIREMAHLAYLKGIGARALMGILDEIASYVLMKISRKRKKSTFIIDRNLVKQILN